MKLWGKVASGMTYVIAAIFVVVAVFVPEARRESIAVAAISIALALFGIPAIVKVFSSFTGDQEILANEVVGSATIASLKPTRWRYNRYYPIVNFRLCVEAGGAAYPVEHKQSVDPELLERLSPGAVVAVRVHREDHKKVAIDWSAPGRAAAGTAVAQPVEPRQAEVFSVGGWYARISNKNFFAFGLLLFGVIFFRLSCEEDYYAKGGVRVQGVVVKKPYTPASTTTGSGNSSKHSISYRFTTKEGRTIEGRYDVLPGAWNSPKEGDPIVVDYLADSPSTNRVPEQRASSVTFEIISAVFLVASVVLFIVAWRQKRTQGK